MTVTVNVVTMVTTTNVYQDNDLECNVIVPFATAPVLDNSGDLDFSPIMICTVGTPIFLLIFLAVCYSFIVLVFFANIIANPRQFPRIGGQVEGKTPLISNVYNPPPLPQDLGRGYK